MFFVNIKDGGEGRTKTPTLLSRLSNLKQYREEDITILTDSEDDIKWIDDMMKDKYVTQRATQCPVKHIVIDTLKNFEGLKSRVILFIIPQSWRSGYVGSLKYQLDVVTRAISRLEFLLPWSSSQREQDLTEIKRAFSLAVGTFVL